LELVLEKTLNLRLGTTGLRLRLRLGGIGPTILTLNRVLGMELRI
jgi:hypothetical protein